MPDHLSNNTEQRLWDGFRSGDTASTDQLLKMYAPLVRSCSRSFFLNGGEMEDLMQEGMLALLNAMYAYSPDRGTSFSSFAAVCIRNRIIDAVKAYGSGRDALDHSLSIDSADLKDEILSGQLCVTDPEDVVIRSELAASALQQLQETLTPLEKEILSDYLAGLSYREIAQRSGRSTKSVDNSIQRIRKKVQSIIHQGNNSER
ncbi:MAG: sigma-70 family RNA polymerase sigma factor [Oscillospiraceae bacterium]|nr:sigma-70 family RNA polymerase sigma factor [Oscillospiraceae bacterium]